MSLPLPLSPGNVPSSVIHAKRSISGQFQFPLRASVKKADVSHRDHILGQGVNEKNEWICSFGKAADMRQSKK